MTDTRAGTAWSVTRNATWLAAARVTSQLLAVVLTIVLARGLGTVGFGRYALVGAVVMIANTVTTFGTDALLIRELAKGRDDPGHLATSAIVLQLLLSTASVIIIVAGAGALPNRSPDTIAALRIYALALLPLAFFSVFSAALRGWERMDLYARLTVGTATLQTAAALLALHLGARLPQVMGALLLAQVGAAALGWWLCRLARPGFALRSWRAAPGLGSLVASSWLLAILSGLSMVSQRLGVVMLSWLAGDAPAGLFAAAARVVEALKLGNYALSGAMLPVASRLTSQQASGPSLAPGPSLTTLLQGSQVVLLGIATLAAAGATLFAAPLVTVLYGHAYGPAVAALRILAWALIPAAVAAPVSMYLVSAGLERIALGAIALAVTVTLGLGVWFIPRTGISGACAAVVAGELIQAAGLFVGGRRRVR